MVDLPVIVTHYPKETQAFYKRTDPEDPDLMLAFDFIAPGRGGELIGGSEREPDLGTLKANLVGRERIRRPTIGTWTRVDMAPSLTPASAGKWTGWCNGSWTSDTSGTRSPSPGPLRDTRRDPVGPRPPPSRGLPAARGR